MKLLFVSKLDRFARAVSTLTKYVQTGKALGHEVAVFGEQSSEIPLMSYSLDVKRFDFVIFIIYESWDFPDMPYLAQLLDGISRERRVIIDCYGRYNETIRIEHDFNHLEKMDGHQGWEWIEGFQAVSDKILQPTLKPLRSDVRSFLFHAYDPGAVVCDHNSPTEAARAWLGTTNGTKPYGVTYVGNNWQRWTQVQRFLEAIEPLRKDLGPISILGSGWDKTPDWAIQLGVHGADVDPILLERLGVERGSPIPFNEVSKFLGQGRFTPIFHRPLFNHLGLVTNRTFETFCADTLPLLMLPESQVEAIYGSDALVLLPGEDIAGRIGDIMRRPDVYWDAVLKTRAHLAQRHSYEQRFQELLGILES
jgi:hypothetical protein